MNSRAMKDYFRAFRFKKLITAETFMMYFWILMGPIQFVEEEDHVMPAFLIYYIGAALILLGLTGMHLNPVGLPKLMFLCPMSRQMRENYVRTRFWVRFLVPATLFVVARVVLWIVFPQQIFYLLIDMMFLMGMLGASFLTTTGSVKTLEASKDQPKLLREKELKGMDGKGLLAFILGVVAWFISCAGIADGRTVHWSIWCMTIPVFIWQVWLSVKMLSHVKYLIPLASDYERMNV